MPTRSRRPLPEERGNDARDDFPVGSAFRLGDDLRHYDLRVLWAFGTGLADHSLRDLLDLRLVAPHLGLLCEHLGHRDVVEVAGFVLREPRLARSLVLSLRDELVHGRTEAR